MSIWAWICRIHVTDFNVDKDMQKHGKYYSNDATILK